MFGFPLGVGVGFSLWFDLVAEVRGFDLTSLRRTRVRHLLHSAFSWLRITKTNTCI